MLDCYSTEDLLEYCLAYELSVNESTRSGYIAAIMQFSHIAKFDIIDDIEEFLATY